MHYERVRKLDVPDVAMQGFPLSLAQLFCVGHYTAIKDKFSSAVAKVVGGGRGLVISWQRDKINSN